MADEIKVEITEEPGPQQPPRTDPITDPPPRHEPYAHGIGGANGADYRPPPEASGMFTPPRPPKTAPKPRGPDRRLHDKIVGTYATMGLLVCAAAETRMQMLGPSDPIGARPDPAKERARRATFQMNQAGVGTVQMAPAAADAWLEVASEYPAVKRALERASEGSAIAGLVAVHAMMLVPYGVAAGWVPEVIGERLASVGQAMGAAAGMDGD
jgi:hypothetical protein